MPRYPRTDTKGAVHHVVSSGAGQGDIFRDDQDHWDLFDRLGRVLPECGSACFAWAFMRNHLHLVLETGHDPLSRVMARLCTGHALAFNRRHNRVGHVFQNRYRTSFVEDDRDLAAVVRDVHSRPLRAAIVEDLKALETYEWTGHAALMGRRRAPFQDLQTVRGLFANEVRLATHTLREFMSEVPGDLKFREVPGDPRLIELIDRVAATFGLRPEQLRTRDRRSEVCRARAIVSHVAHTRFDLPMREIARTLRVDPGTVQRGCVRGARLLSMHPEFLPPVEGE